MQRLGERLLSVSNHVCHQSREVFSHSSITSPPISLFLFLRLPQCIFRPLGSVYFSSVFFFRSSDSMLFSFSYLQICWFFFSPCSNSLLKSSGVVFISVIVLLRYRISFWFLFMLSIYWNFHFVRLLFSCFCPYIPLVLWISWRQLF